MKIFSDDIKAYIIDCGASLVHFGNLKGLTDSFGEGIEGGIVFAVPLSKDIVKGISSGPTVPYYDEYESLNEKLEDMAFKTSKFLNEKGFKAVPLTASNVDAPSETLISPLPFKTIAARSGMGWIGKSGLLVTREFGSAFRMAAVLTDAELKFGEPVTSSLCGSCSICRDACPGGAITGNNWSINESRSYILDAFKCRKTARELASRINVNHSICGICISLCPWTRKYIDKD